MRKVPAGTCGKLRRGTENGEVERAEAACPSGKTYRTQGGGETRTVNVKKGTYRVKCYGKAFPIPAPALDATSNTVKIKP